MNKINQIPGNTKIVSKDRNMTERYGICQIHMSVPTNNYKPKNENERKPRRQAKTFPKNKRMTNPESKAKEKGKK